jgi:hypothetical protein
MQTREANNSETPPAAQSAREPFSATWMLFEGGGRVQVDVTLHAAARETARPVDAYIVTECEGEFTKSARRAAEAVYEFARRAKPGIEPLVAGYDLSGLPGNRAVAGESGGLAFAVCLAKKLLRRDPGAVAATGVVQSGHGGGPLGAVRGIRSKLEAAGRVVPEDGWILYPRENDPDIPASLRRSLTAAGLRLRGVSGVAEALELLFREPRSAAEIRPASSKWKTRLLKWVLPVVTGLFALLALARIHGWPPFAPPGIPPAERLEKPAGETTAADESRARVAAKDSASAGAKAEEHASSAIRFRFKGRTALAAELAPLLEEALKTLLQNDPQGKPRPLVLTCRLEIRSVSETPVAGGTELSSALAVALRDLSAASGRAVRRLGSVEVKVEGKGRAENLLPAAAGRLAREIAGLLEKEARGSSFSPPSARPAESGFE